MMTEPSTLSDSDLLARAQEWRRQALQGALHARGRAHEYEVEVRRRFASRTTAPAALESEPTSPRRWPFWRRNVRQR